MLERLKTRIATSSKYSRWFWWGVLFLTFAVVAGGFFLRRRAILGRLGQLRVQLAQKNQQLLDAKTAADTARHSDAIDRHNAAAAQIQTEIAGIESQIKDVEGEHQDVLAQINAAQDWGALEDMRRKGNAR